MTLSDGRGGGAFARLPAFRFSFRRNASTSSPALEVRYCSRSDADSVRGVFATGSDIQSRKRLSRVDRPAGRHLLACSGSAPVLLPPYADPLAALSPRWSGLGVCRMVCDDLTLYV